MAELPKVTINETAHRFELSLDGETAVADYRLSPGVMVLPHTLVPAVLEGRGVGSALARAALDHAREHRLKIKPTCPFIAGYVARHPEDQDLLHADFRNG